MKLSNLPSFGPCVGAKNEGLAHALKDLQFNEKCRHTHR